MKAVLIYDGVCKFCIAIVKKLERVSGVNNSDRELLFIPYQKAGDLKERFNLTNEQLMSSMHLISDSGQIYAGGRAIEKLSEYFPSLEVLGAFFKTGLGKWAYKSIAKKRHRLFGCSESCYISNFASPIVKTFDNK